MRQHFDIDGWGADAWPQDRPGVPAEVEPPHPIGNVTIGPIVRQETGRPAVESPLRPLTPVYGTSTPPRGLSGVIRRLAYRIPDYKARRYILLLLADRIDVLEHPTWKPVTMIAAIVVGVVGLRRLRLLAR